MIRVHTPSQTVGPFFHLGLEKLDKAFLAPAGTPDNETISIRGKLYDADLNPVPDAQLEIWQADPRGLHPKPHATKIETGAPHFSGFGRIPTNAHGEFHFTTVKPGAVPGPNGSVQAPHIVVLIFMRGLLRHLATRIYFPGDPCNDSDPILLHVPVDRRATLVAVHQASAPNHFEWNILLQGENETVFFDL
jgi:protocatechuate 3,4-dioxygenase alpha subunit